MRSLERSPFSIPWCIMIRLSFSTGSHLKKVIGKSLTQRATHAVSSTRSTGYKRTRESVNQHYTPLRWVRWATHVLFIIVVVDWMMETWCMLYSHCAPLCTNLFPSSATPPLTTTASITQHIGNPPLIAHQWLGPGPSLLHASSLDKPKFATRSYQYGHRRSRSMLLTHWTTHVHHDEL